MKGTENSTRSTFTARVQLGLRELDGIEQAPDVSEIVAQRLEDPVPGAQRPRLGWPGIVAAVLAAAVTAALLVQHYLDRGGNDSPPFVEAQDPVGPWRLVYELPVDELQRSLQGDKSGDLEQLLAQCVSGVQTRLGALGTVTRGDATTFTVDLESASRDGIGDVRSIIESAGRLEMRMLADEDYAVSGVRFDMGAEREQLLAWLDAGGRERLLANPATIGEYRARSEHLRWFHRFVWPDGRRAGRWGVPYSQIPRLGVVAVHAEADWNQGVIPAHVQARPTAERFLLELFPINMHETHFEGGDLDPAATRMGEDRQNGTGPWVSYRLRPNRSGEYADFSERGIGRCCAMLWNDEVLSAPRFESRIPGVGRVNASTRRQAETIAAALRAPLPVAPRLLRSEPRKVK